MGNNFKRILYLSFYFEPDLCAGSFRNTPLAKELATQVRGVAEIDILTTAPNRYQSFKVHAELNEKGANYNIIRIKIPEHRSGMLDQVKSFYKYYCEVKKLVKGKKYDLVFASSSRLFTAYLGYIIASRKNIPLYLDIRDIFTDTMKDVLNVKILKLPIIGGLRVIEKRIFNYATHINLISGGFENYFKKFNCKNFSYFSNGIDDEFLNLPKRSQSRLAEAKTILYAGNIGEGQGLHKIIPRAAKLLGCKYKFIIIGSGGAEDLLRQELTRYDVNNVELLKPVGRSELIDLYSKADFLFLHLNDYEAFKKVLPSKVFELGAFDKPILAGVAGYAFDFIQINLSNVLLFKPGDFEDMISQLNSYQYANTIRVDFINKFKRSEINIELAKSIVKYIT